MGCGSGILAIAALRLGARHAVAIDIDDAAREVTLENARSEPGGRTSSGVDGHRFNPSPNVTISSWRIFRRTF